VDVAVWGGGGVGFGDLVRGRHIVSNCAEVRMKFGGSRWVVRYGCPVTLGF
jgi:hypothetical protein